MFRESMPSLSSMLREEESRSEEMGTKNEKADRVLFVPSFTSFGTPVFSNLQGYKDVPLTSMPYGQSMAMLMLGEYSRRFL